MHIGIDPKDIEATSTPEVEALDRVLHAWHVCYGITPATLKQAVQDIGLSAAHVQGQPAHQWNDLQDALGAALDVCHVKQDGKTLRSESIGYVLRKWQGRVIDGMRLIKDGTQQRASKWRIDLI